MASRRREGIRYCLGASLLELSAQVTPERRLRAVARRPLAELAAVTGAAVGLSTTIGGEAVFLDTMDARVPLGLPEPGSRVPPGTAPARVHTEIGCPAPIVDAGGYLAHISCVAVAVPLRRGQVAVVTALVARERPSLGLLAGHPSRWHPNRHTATWDTAGPLAQITKARLQQETRSDAGRSGFFLSG